MSNFTYDGKRAWLDLQTALLEDLPDEVDIDLRYDSRLGISAAVRKWKDAPDSLALHIFSGPAVAADWKTLVLMDVAGSLGRYHDIPSAVKIADKWVRGKLRRRKP